MHCEITQELKDLLSPHKNLIDSVLLSEFVFDRRIIDIKFTKTYVCQYISGTDVYHFEIKMRDGILHFTLDKEIDYPSTISHIVFTRE